MTVAAKKLELPTEARSRADEMLKQAAAIKAKLDLALTVCQNEAAVLVKRHAETTAPLKRQLEALDKQIKAHAKKHQVDLFAGKDRVDFANGALLRKEEQHVRHTRGMLDRLEEIGADDAIKTVKSVDWDVLEKWTDERLIEAGTERFKKETFAYELFGGGSLAS
jgi:phage host-nuclease inhibitor protein Gam